jgi:peptide/nickel transport system ATP-binding protein
MLEIKNIKVELDSDAGLVRAIDGMRLTLQRGETFALVGESGCGKSMTALALMRLLPENGYIASGDVLVDQQDVLSLPESQMRAIRGGKIGMIFQEPSTSLNPVMKIGDQIVEAIEAHTTLRGEAARAKALDWLRKVGIPEPERRIDDYPFRMSGGQKQRVMIAMTLAGEPDYIIADEPTTALDVTIQAQVLDLLKQLQAEHGLGLLLITHDLAVVSGMAHRVALMYAGQIIEVATAEEFFTAPKHPYAKALLRALPDAARRGQALAAIPGTVPPLTLQFEGCRFEPRCYCAEPACKTTLPELYILPGTRSVRCLRYAPGHDPAATEAVINIVPADPAKVHESAKAGTVGQPVLQVDKLRVRFPIRKGLLQRVHGYFDAVDGVSFKVQPGRTLALVGESGCGKTTTGKAIVQLLRHQATFEGQALLEGQNLFDLQGEVLQKARRDIQIIFQDPFASLNPRMRVFDILEEGLLSLQPDLDATARRDRLQQLADQVGLRREALGRYPHEFSGGQRQRIAIARALAVRPKLIVCDEPTSALDVSVQAQILNLLRGLQAELGVSYLFITHNIGVVEYVADEVAVMRAGRIVEQGVCEDVLNRPQDAYTRKLIASVPRLRASAELT